MASASVVLVLNLGIFSLNYPAAVDRSKLLTDDQVFRQFVTWHRAKEKLEASRRVQLEASMERTLAPLLNARAGGQPLSANYVLIAKLCAKSEPILT